MSTKSTVKDIEFDKGESSGIPLDERKVSWIYSMRDRAYKASAYKFDRWDKNVKLYRGEHWDESDMPDYKAKITDNRIFANIESALPIIVDNRPKSQIEAKARSDVAAAEWLQKIYDQRWEELNLDLTVAMTVQETLVAGETYWKIFWNPALKDGDGDVDVVAVDPRRVWPDPDCRDPLLRDCRYVVYEAYESLIDLKLRYPDKANKLEERYNNILDSFDSTKPSVGEMITTKGDEAHDSGDTPDGTTYTSIKRMYTGSEKLRVTEIWVDDKTVETIYPEYIIVADTLESMPLTEVNKQTLIEQGMEEDKDFIVVTGKELPDYGYPEEKVVRRKYPNGRILACCDDILLYDKPFGYEHGRCPYVRFFRYRVPFTNDFLGEADQIKPLNYELNKRKAQTVDIMNLTANPPMVVNVSSGVNTDKITNEPGLIIPVHMDTRAAIQWLQPPNIPAALFEQIAMVAHDIDEVSGIHDVTKGQRPVGVTSGVAIDTLQEAAQTRLRLAARYLEWSLKAATEIMISIIWQYYREERTVRTRDGDGELQYETVDISKFGKFVGGMPDVRIIRGSTMSTNKSVLKQQALELFAAGAIDRKALLDMFDFPNAEAILDRMGNGNPNIQVQPQGVM